MIVHAILAVLTTRQDPSAPGLIRLTRHEIRHLFIKLTRILHPPLHVIAWSIWRASPTKPPPRHATNDAQPLPPTHDHPGAGTMITPSVAIVLSYAATEPRLQRRRGPSGELVKCVDEDEFAVFVPCPAELRGTEARRD